jgi:hypothetical protein
MNWESLLTGMGVLACSYLLYIVTKWSGKASENNNWRGSTPGNYYSSWMLIIFGIIVGIVFLIRSLPSHI